MTFILGATMANKKNPKIDLKEAGLEIGLRFLNFFLKSDYLHYGYFTPDLEVDISNFAKAQENYTEMLLSLIPDKVKTILDVGCGSGKTAQRLLDSGYRVDCVSPGELLTNHVRERIGHRIELFNCNFEDLKTPKKYDLILFSESFQYIPIEESIKGVLSYTNPKGYIIVADFFKTDATGKSPIGGGHKLSKWEAEIKKAKIEEIKSMDITKETSPTFDIINKLYNEVLFPLWNVIFLLLKNRLPLLMKLLKWKFKKRIEKIEKKHFTGQRNGANFRKYKKYMVYLLRKSY